MNDGSRVTDVRIGSVKMTFEDSWGVGSSR